MGKLKFYSLFSVSDCTGTDNAILQMLKRSFMEIDRLNELNEELLEKVKLLEYLKKAVKIVDYGNHTAIDFKTFWPTDCGFHELMEFFKEKKEE